MRARSGALLPQNYEALPGPNIGGLTLKIYEETYHGTKKHRNQARAHLVLGRAYEAKRLYPKALQEYLASEEIYNVVLKEKEIDDISEVYKALAILGVRMKDGELAHKYLKLHTTTFGLDHPRTKEIFQYLDQQEASHL